MNRAFKITVLTLTLTMLLAGSGWCEDKPNWTPVTGNKNNMVVFGDVFMFGQKVNDSGYRLGAFGPNGTTDCRAVADISEDGSFYLTIRGDRNGEPIGFRVYNKRVEKVYELASYILFKSDATVAGLELH